MDRQKTIERITEQLPYLDDEVLESVWHLLKHVEPMDAWEQQIMNDSEAGKLDQLINQANADYQAGKISKLVKD